MTFNKAKSLARKNWMVTGDEWYVLLDDDGDYQVADDFDMDTFYLGIDPVWHPADGSIGVYA